MAAGGAKKGLSWRYFYFKGYVKDSVLSYWQSGLGIVQCCNIVPTLVSSIGESWDLGLYFALQLPRGFDHFYGGPPPLPSPPALPRVRGGAGKPHSLPREGSPQGGASIPGLYELVWICKILTRSKASDNTRALRLLCNSEAKKMPHSWPSLVLELVQEIE